jgi:hypothetical protein
LSPNDEEQKKRMVVPKKQSEQNLFKGVTHTNSSRELSPQDRYNRMDNKGSPSPPVGQIKKGTVFKKSPANMSADQNAGNVQRPSNMMP